MSHNVRLKIHQPHVAEVFVVTHPASRPLKTISAGVRALKPGDTLIIREGIYRETVDISLKGKMRLPITIRAAEGEHVVVSGADMVKNWKKARNTGERPVWVVSPFPAWKMFTYNPAVGHERQAGPPAHIRQSHAVGINVS